MKLPETLTARWATFEELGPNEVHDLLKLRQDVFVLEQTSLYPDIDGKDPIAWHFHIWDKESGKLFGAIRLFVTPENNEARIGRVVIAQEGRGAGLGHILMQSGIDKAEELVRGCAIHVSAQAYLEKFYNSIGFETVSEVYIEDGIPHIDMIRSGRQAD
ncbi:MAG: GNAT family N-acetyltransferase [Roseibium sp.]|uniref:GNAT family N-acetyltransferase n=1 Tax=Roseibium sp. TaxID=1936156 RepID=UPI002612A8A8|nr:GNAT family N-acetyltransferase [Roseibium sp.]MCV0429847.1 GNAT family N-acetyltransferase [Roseibium sp.]